MNIVWILICDMSYSARYSIEMSIVGSYNNVAI